MRSRALKSGMTLGALLAVPLFGWALASCATVVTPQVGLSDPVEVFVVDHGRTSSLIVPAPDGTLLRYAYGDWNWYALGNHSVWAGISALFWPSPAAFGRGQFAGPATVDNVRHQVPSPEEILSIPVERARLFEFEARMEALHASGRDAEVSNPAVGLSFVPHPHDYSVAWNSNHAVASWLRELGSTTRGCSVWANWQVVEQAADAR